MIGRADIEGSKSNVAMNAWLPQASYPCVVRKTARHVRAYRPVRARRSCRRVQRRGQLGGQVQVTKPRPMIGGSSWVWLRAQGRLLEEEQFRATLSWRVRCFGAWLMASAVGWAGRLANTFDGWAMPDTMDPFSYPYFGA